MTDPAPIQTTDPELLRLELALRQVDNVRWALRLALDEMRRLRACREEAARLRDALGRYGAHDDTCPSSYAPLTSPEAV